MSQGYMIQRQGQCYEAANFSILATWIKHGRIKQEDLIKAPHDSEWKLVTDIPELIVLFPQNENLLIRRGDQVYKAPHFNLIKEWAKVGKVTASDHIYFPSKSKWVSVGSFTEIVELIAHSHSARSLSKDQTHHVHREPAMVENSKALPVVTSPIPVLKSNLPSSSISVLNEKNVVPANQVSSIDQEVLPLVSNNTHDLPDLDNLSTQENQLNSVLLPPIIADQESMVEALPTATAWGLSSSILSKFARSALDHESRPPQPEKMPILSLEHRYIKTPTVVSPIIQPTDVIKQVKSALNSSINQDELNYIYQYFYDLARLFMICKDMRPLELLQGTCFVPTLQQNLESMEKKKIFEIIYQHLLNQIQPQLTNILSNHTQHDTLKDLHQTSQYLLHYFEAGLDCIGLIGVDRIVIGNQNRPKMTAEEEKCMIDLHHLIKQAILIIKQMKKANEESK
jgi:hypothetical protein